MEDRQPNGKVHFRFWQRGGGYDRNVFDYLALERSKGTFPTYERNFNVQGHPCDSTTDPSCLEWDPAFFERANLEALVAANPNLGREINLINNDLKTPYSDQFSLGVRNRFDLWNHGWNTSATVAYVGPSILPRSSVTGRLAPERTSAGTASFTACVNSVGSTASDCTPKARSGSSPPSGETRGSFTAKAVT